MSDFGVLRRRMDVALRSFLGEQRELLAEASPVLEQVSDSLEDFLLVGGKRVRPLFCYWGALGAGLDDSDQLITAAAALELLQAAALIHDDVMDASDTRRGRPAVHVEFAQVHEKQGWRGDAASFGAGAAILLGDLCLIWGDRMLDSCGLGDDQLRRARPVHDLMRSEVMSGQFLDLVEQVGGEGTVESALRVARYKSAKYTIERPLHLGAALAGAGAGLTTAYSEYGLPLGEAFQVRDDVLGIFGDPAETGKPAGDDLREGKRTVLIAAAFSAASPGQRDLLERGLGDPDLSPERVEELREVLVDTGALTTAEQLIAERTDAALKALAAAPVTESARDALGELAHAATARRV